MAILPPYVAVAYRKGWARSFNQPLELTYPPGTLEFEISPALKDEFWLVYGWHYGDIYPSEPTSNFMFYWIQSGIEKFADPLTKSVIGFSYPVFLRVTKGDPVVTIAQNNTGEAQTVDFFAFVALFKGEAAFNEWERWFKRKYEVTPADLEDKLVDIHDELRSLNMNISEVLEALRLGRRITI